MYNRVYNIDRSAYVINDQICWLIMFMRTLFFNSCRYAVSTRGKQVYSDAAFRPGDTLVFGPETRGLPQSYLDGLAPEQILRIPMLAHSRSLNLSNAVAVLVYEALRQNGFASLRRE